MSRVAELVAFERVVEDGAHGADVIVDPGGGATVTAPHFADPGDDAQPLPGDYVALSDSSGSGAEHATGYADVTNAGKAGPGEKRLYARAASGTVVIELWLKGDGSLVVDNGKGKLELAPGGTVTINGVAIDPQGNVKAPGEVSAMNASAPVKLSTHIHPTGVGPSSPPTPGT